MSLHPQLNEALEETREGLTTHAARRLNDPDRYKQMKARFALNVFVPFIDWFRDEASTGEIDQAATAATRGISHMVALLASTAGDDKMERSASLIFATLMEEMTHYMVENKKGRP